MQAVVAAFRAECAARAAAAEKADRMIVVGRGGWLFLARELRHVSVGRFWGPAARKVSRARKPEHADPLPAILDFHRQLEALGIELLLVPVPPKAVVYPEQVSDKVALPQGTPRRLDPQHRAFYKLLGEKGVPVLDLTPEFLARRGDKAGALYCKHDTHWSGLGCVLAAEQIARHIRGRPWLKGIRTEAFASETREVEIAGDLWRSLADETVPKERLPLRFVGRKVGGGLEPVEPDRKSPVLLLADSHGLVFHAGRELHAKGAGLADQLASELRFAVDVLGVRGSGATPARASLFRRGRRDPGYIGGKKLIIWCFSAREFTEAFGGWMRLPVVRK